MGVVRVGRPGWGGGSVHLAVEAVQQAAQELMSVLLAEDNRHRDTDRGRRGRSEGAGLTCCPQTWDRISGSGS